jgi:hypothetical protein
MAVYTVHEPAPKARATSAPGPERFIFVRDGFSFWALLFGPLWMLWHRMWLVLLGYAVVVAALAFVVRLHGSATVGTMVGVLLALLLGFEAGTVRRFTLGRRRFRHIGIVVGDDLELAERRFFDAWIRGDSAVSATPGGPALAPSPRMPRPSSDVSDVSNVLGLFPEPGATP